MVTAIKVAPSVAIKMKAIALSRIFVEPGGVGGVGGGGLSLHLNVTHDSSNDQRKMQLGGVTHGYPGHDSALLHSDMPRVIYSSQ
jgi:hypothetical protein